LLQGHRAVNVDTGYDQVTTLVIANRILEIGRAHV
jgi:hypothetical protein